jgi:hypothetical protein
MDTLRLVCHGITDGQLTIPPFNLRQGQALCLQIPYPVGAGVQEQLYQLLMGFRPNPGLQLLTDVRWVSACGIPVRRSLLDLLRDSLLPSPRAVDWLRRTGSMSYDQAAIVVTRLGFQANCRMNRLAGTPKTLLGLEAAWGSGAQVLVLSVSGLDPLGRQAVFSAAAKQLNHCAVLHLAYPCWFQGEVYQDAVPGVPCLSLGWEGSQLRPATLPEILSNRAS